MEQELKDIHGNPVTADLGRKEYPELFLGGTRLSVESTHRLAHMLADLVLVSREGGCPVCGR